MKRLSIASIPFLMLPPLRYKPTPGPNTALMITARPAGILKTASLSGTAAAMAKEVRSLRISAKAAISGARIRMPHFSGPNQRPPRPGTGSLPRDTPSVPKMAPGTARRPNNCARSTTTCTAFRKTAGTCLTTADADQPLPVWEKTSPAKSCPRNRQLKLNASPPLS